MQEFRFLISVARGRSRSLRRRNAVHKKKVHRCKMQCEIAQCPRLCTFMYKRVGCNKRADYNKRADLDKLGRRNDVHKKKTASLQNAI